MTSETPTRRTVWPYILPIVAFLILVELSRWVDDRFAVAMMIVRVLVPAGLLIAFARRGEYPELRWRLGSMTILDVVVGVSLAVMWMLPYVWFPELRPKVDATQFDPMMAGANWMAWVLGIRMVGYAIVTPVMEELFMRSFLMRYADVFDSDDDFRTIPLARFTLQSFLVVVVVFLLTHQMWEWWVMLPWAVLTNLWFYYRKDLLALIVVHACTNATILMTVIALDGQINDGAGNPMSLWFFV